MNINALYVFLFACIFHFPNLRNRIVLLNSIPKQAESADIYVMFFLEHKRQPFRIASADIKESLIINTITAVYRVSLSV